MKKVSLAVAASFSLLSFGAYAGGDCQYGHSEEFAQVVEDAVIVSEEVDANLLALVKKQEGKMEKIKPIATFN